MKIGTSAYNLSTRFPQKLWKTVKTPAFSRGCLILLCCVLLSSCAYLKGNKKQVGPSQQAAPAGEAKPPVQVKVTGGSKPGRTSKPTADKSLLSLSQDEVRSRFGEPTIASITPDNHALWTYKPSWKLMPDNKDTVYIEFEDGKVIRVTGVK
jgi:hypothetical protein